MASNRGINQYSVDYFTGSFVDVCLMPGNNHGYEGHRKQDCGEVCYPAGSLLYSEILTHGSHILTPPRRTAPVTDVSHINNTAVVRRGLNPQPRVREAIALPTKFLVSYFTGPFRFGVRISKVKVHAYTGSSCSGASSFCDLS